MPKTITLLIFILLTCSGSRAVPQEKSTDQKNASPASSTETEQPKSEVETMLEDAKKRGETVYGVCLENCENREDTIQGILLGKPLSLPKPAYSSLARMAHVSGTVQVKVIVDYDGKIIAASAISGHPLLAPNSVKAARESLFEPCTLDGKPIKVVGVINYNFVAQ